MITVVISLDTELAWGRLSHDKATPLSEDESAGRNAIKYILDVFDTHQIPATWGIVGHLLLDSCNEETHYRAPYIDAVDPGTDQDTNPLYYAPEILNWIQTADVSHEVAGHSFSHPRFGEIDRSQAQTELEAMVRAFEDRGVSIESIIHPGIDLAHLDLLKAYGISCYSGASAVSNCTIKTGLPKLLRRDRELVSIPTIEPIEDEYGMVRIPRSRSLRDERWGWLNPYRLKRALKVNDDGMLHLSFHPHNIVYDWFLRHTLSKIAKILSEAESKGTIEICTFEQVESMSNGK
jgi:peptidoglycan/xylan/chitin deacetylase (PgdA/CDA1 family)